MDFAGPTVLRRATIATAPRRTRLGTESLNGPALFPSRNGRHMGGADTISHLVRD
jgi:hypothetical protein